MRTLGIWIGAGLGAIAWGFAVAWLGPLGAITLFAALGLVAFALGAFIGALDEAEE